MGRSAIIIERPIIQREKTLIKLGKSVICKDGRIVYKGVFKFACGGCWLGKSASIGRTSRGEWMKNMVVISDYGRK